MRRILKIAANSLAGLVSLLALLWAMGALWYDLPLPASVRKAIAVVFLLGSLWLVFSGSMKRRVIAAVLFVALTGWWLSLKPSDHRPWLGDVDRTAWAEIEGDEVTLHNVRNCDYRTETDFTASWETRKVRLSQITGIDLAINYWGSPYMAHPIVSFQFADSPPVCFSIETRKEQGESYSAIGGIYRQYELIYIVADERDVIRVRTNYRKGEEIYLYHLNLTPERARGRFLEYLTTVNQLHAKPEWYHALTNNCTTTIRTQHNTGKQNPWDWRILVNGKADEMLYEKGAIGDGTLPFAELKKRSLIDEDAKVADKDPDFSARIRAHAPTFPPTVR